MNFLNDIILMATGEGGSLGEVAKPVVNQFFEIAKIVFPVVLGIGAILVIIKLVLLGIKLAQSGDDPEQRSKVIKGMVWWGIGLLILVAGAIVSGVLFDQVVKAAGTQT